MESASEPACSVFLHSPEQKGKMQRPEIGSENSGLKFPFAMYGRYQPADVRESATKNTAEDKEA